MGKISFKRWLVEKLYLHLIWIGKGCVFCTTGIGEFTVGILGLLISCMILTMGVLPTLWNQPSSLWSISIPSAFALFFVFLCLHGAYRDEVKGGC